MQSTRTIHSRVLRLFNYRRDIDNFGKSDYWKSFADQVEQRRRFSGDCDNFAMTCAEIAHRQGYDPDTILLCLCWTELNEYHAACIIGSELLDNRFKIVLDWSVPKYKWDRAMKLSEPGVWRQMN